MEMMEGGELFHRISQHRHFTEKQASEVTKQASLNPPTDLPILLLYKQTIWDKRTVKQKINIFQEMDWEEARFKIKK